MRESFSSLKDQSLGTELIRGARSQPTCNITTNTAPKMQYRDTTLSTLCADGHKVRFKPEYQDLPCDGLKFSANSSHGVGGLRDTMTQWTHDVTICQETKDVDECSSPVESIVTDDGRIGKISCVVLSEAETDSGPSIRFVAITDFDERFRSNPVVSDAFCCTGNGANLRTEPIRYQRTPRYGTDNFDQDMDVVSPLLAIGCRHGHTDTSFSDELPKWARSLEDLVGSHTASFCKREGCSEPIEYATDGGSSVAFYNQDKQRFDVIKSSTDPFSEGVAQVLLCPPLSSLKPTRTSKKKTRSIPYGTL